MWNKMKQWITTILGYFIIIIAVLAVITLLALFGGVYMHLFGFQYETVASLVLFFIIVSIISVPLESFSLFITNILIQIGIAKEAYGVFYIVLDVSTCFITMNVVDCFMPSIVSTKLSILIFALTMSFITVYFERKGL